MVDNNIVMSYDDEHFLKRLDCCGYGKRKPHDLMIEAKTCTAALQDVSITFDRQSFTNDRKRIRKRTLEAKWIGLKTRGSTTHTMAAEKAILFQIVINSNNAI